MFVVAYECMYDYLFSSFGQHLLIGVEMQQPVVGGPVHIVPKSEVLPHASGLVRGLGNMVVGVAQDGVVVDPHHRGGCHAHDQTGHCLKHTP